MCVYSDAYPKLECFFCGVESDEVVVYHQRTQYVDIEDNYVAACPVCREQNDDYWDDMWAEYYSGCM